MEDGDILEQGKRSCFSPTHAISEETQPHGHWGEKTRSIEGAHQKWLNTNLTSIGRRNGQ